MGYIDLTYYKTTFLGNDPGDDTEISRYIARASDMVDLLTDQKAQEYDDLPSYQQVAIQKATAYITEYFVDNGDAYNEEGGGSEKIGAWSVSGGTGSSSGISKTALAWLAQADLMSMSIEVAGSYETYQQ